MTAALPDRQETVLFENLADLKARENSSLPNWDLDLGHEHVAMVSSPHLGRVCCFEKQRQCFDQVCPGLFDRRALAGDVEFRTQRDEAIVLSLDDGGQALSALHDLSLHHATWPYSHLADLTSAGIRAAWRKLARTLFIPKPPPLDD